MGLQLEASDNLLRLRLDEQEGLSLEVAVGEQPFLILGR